MTTVAQHSPGHANRARLIGAIHIADLGQADLAMQLVHQVDTTTLTGDEPQLLAHARALISRPSTPPPASQQP